MTTLLIWDTCGDQAIALYAVSGKHEELVRQCHGQYINSADCPDDAAVYKLNELAYVKGRHGLMDIPGFRTINKHDRKPMQFDDIIICGFIP